MREQSDSSDRFFFPTSCRCFSRESGAVEEVTEPIVTPPSESPSLPSVAAIWVTRKPHGGQAWLTPIDRHSQQLGYRRRV